MTPYQLYLHNQAYEMRFKRDNIINLSLLNNVTSFIGGDSITFDDIFNYKTLKDYKLKQMEDFRENGKINIEKWNEYSENIIKPAKIELGMEV